MLREAVLKDMRHVLGATPMINTGRIALLDLKRGSNIEIMLSKMNPDVEAIARAVQSMDAAALDAESVAGMIRFLPTADECVLLARNSLEATFATPEEKAALVARLRAYCEGFSA